MHDYKIPKIDFFGVGTSRSGSTWLASCLAEHPEIFIPKAKELHFFRKRRYFYPGGKISPLGVHYLRKYFKTESDQYVRGEITPSYLLYPFALKRIKKNYPESKIICILRDPVERAYSHYRFLYSNKGKEMSESFEEALEGKFYNKYVNLSLYSEKISYIKENFDQSNVKILLYDSLKSNPDSIIKETYRFLGVSTYFIPSSLSKYIHISHSSRENAPDNRNYKNQLLTLAERTENFDGTNISCDRKKSIFYKYFYRDIERLEDIMGIDLDQWKP